MIGSPLRATERGDARNTTTVATSSGERTRPIPIPDAYRDSISSKLTPAAAAARVIDSTQISVLVWPGCKQTTLIPRVIAQYAAHDLSGDAEEVSTVLPANAILINETHVGLVDQRRRFQNMARALFAHKGMREPMQLLFDQRSQRLKRGLVAITPTNKEFGDF